MSQFGQSASQAFYNQNAAATSNFAGVGNDDETTAPQPFSMNNNASLGDPSAGTFGQPGSGNNGGGGSADASGEFGSEKRKYLRLANEVSFGKLENHLREYIRSIPFRPAPTYIAPGEKPPSAARPSKFNPDWDQVFERDETQQDVLNHSASFRYCTQRLAMGFHAPFEANRRVVDYKDFARVLSVPNPTNYEKLDPRVEDIPEHILNENSAQEQLKLHQERMARQQSQATANSKFLEARLNAAKKKGVQLKMSKVDVSKELARMDAEDAQDEEENAAEMLEKKKAERDAQREADRKKKEAEDAARGRPQVVNMYDLPDWRQATGRCHVNTLESWRTTTTGYF